MKSADFPQRNVEVAKNQSEYNTLFAFAEDDGTLTFCWSLTFRERVKLLFTGKLWHSVLTFRAPLQPQRLTIDNPFNNDDTGKA